MAVEQGLYSQVVIFRQKDFYNKNKKRIPRHITSQGSMQDQYACLIFIMSYKKI